MSNELDIFFDEITGLGDRGNSVSITHPDICKTFDLEEQNLLRKLNNTNPVLHRCGGLVVTLSCWRVFMFLPKEIMNNFIK